MTHLKIYRAFVPHDEYLLNAYSEIEERVGMGIERHAKMKHAEAISVRNAPMRNTVHKEAYVADCTRKAGKSDFPILLLEELGMEIYGNVFTPDENHTTQDKAASRNSSPHRVVLAFPIISDTQLDLNVMGWLPKWGYGGVIRRGSYPMASGPDDIMDGQMWVFRGPTRAEIIVKSVLKEYFDDFALSIEDESGQFNFQPQAPPS